VWRRKLRQFRVVGRIKRFGKFELFFEFRFVRKFRRLRIIWWVKWLCKLRRLIWVQ
jgi:hypothetical protein